VLSQLPGASAAGSGTVLALFLVAIGIGSAGYAAFFGDRLGCFVLALLGILWLWVNKPIEGDILLVLTQHHGITVADLFSVACFGMAGFGWSRSQRRRDRALSDPIPHPRGEHRHGQS
jgi:hypothetical protein